MRILGVVSSSSREVPNAPTIGTATDVGTGRAFNNGAATVTFTAPTWTGGLPITGYTVTSSPGGFTGTGSASPITVTGLQSNTNYTFTVRATNAVGTSAASAASNNILATTVPQAPTIGTATDGGTGSTVSVAFTGNATGGKAISTYTATSSPGGLTGSSASSPITVSGLTAGTAYTFTVTATNANGTSTASAASNSVTPQVPTSYDSIASFVMNNTVGTYTFSSIPSTYSHLQIRFSVRGRDGSNADSGSQLCIQFNGDTAANYAALGVVNSGNVGNPPSTLQSPSTSNPQVTVTSGTGGLKRSFNTGGVIDILDYKSTTIRKRFDVYSGSVENNSSVRGNVWYGTGNWNNTNAINSITIYILNATHILEAGTISLYGIRG